MPEHTNEYIRKRKSIRKYDPSPLDRAALDKVREYIKTVKPLYPDIQYCTQITNKTKGLFNVKAPHYLVFGSEDKDGAYENIGFIGQQIDLFLSGAGFGACWLGGAKSAETEDLPLPCVLCMSFGKPAEPLHRSQAEFKRKPKEKIYEGTDARLEAARLAPSGMNAQRWYFVCDNSLIHCYRKKSMLEFTDKLAKIDMGIALCHIARESESFKFVKEQGVEERKGYVYVGTVKP